jgi:hypothetical protein
MEIQEAGSNISIKYRGRTSSSCYYHGRDYMAMMAIGWSWCLLWCSYALSMWQHWCHIDLSWSYEAWTCQTYWCWCVVYSVSLSSENNWSSMCPLNCKWQTYLQNHKLQLNINFTWANSTLQILHFHLEFEGGVLRPIYLGPYHCLSVYIIYTRIRV